MESIASLGLHPMVELRWQGAASCELTDHRTGFRILVEELAGAAELEPLCADLGLQGSETPLERVLALQHGFRQAQAWDERLERFRSTLAGALAAVPFYRRRAAEYRATLVRAPEDLVQLPRLTRRDVHAHFLELCAEGVDFQAKVLEGSLELVRTSGTTAERMQAFSDPNLVRIPGNYHELWGVHAAAQVPRTAVLTSATCIAERCTLDAADFHSRITHEHTLFLPAVRDLFSMTRQEAQAIADDLQRFAPELLLVNPVYAHWFARKVQEFGLELPQLRAVISSYQYLTLAQRRAISGCLGAPVFNQYAATELGGCQIGLECRFGRLHAREDHCLVEFLGRDGRACANGVGAIVVTTLERPHMPLIRYVVGDLGEPSNEPCRCLFEEWPSFTLHGRERDALVFGDRWITTRQLDTVIAAEPGVDFYACKQLGGRLSLDVIPALDVALDVRGLAARVEAALECSRVQVNVVKRLEPAPSLKYPASQRSAPSAEWFQPC